MSPCLLNGTYWTTCSGPKFPIFLGENVAGSAILHLNMGSYLGSMKSFTTFREYVLNIRSAKGRGPSFHPSFCCKSSHPFWSSAYWPKAPLKHRPTTLPLPTRSTNSLVDLCHAFVYIATSADTPVPKRNCPRGQACSFCHKTSHFVMLCQRAAKGGQASRTPTPKT